MARLDRITTRAGDGGESSLFDGSRRRKDDLLFQAMGDVDELTSHLGALKAALRPAISAKRRRLRSEIDAIQQVLLRIGTVVATPETEKLPARFRPPTALDVEELEAREHALLEKTKIPSRFVLPGETHKEALADIARAVCRRAERSFVACPGDSPQLAVCLSYLNRLSDYLFILARSLS